MTLAHLDKHRSGEIVSISNERGVAQRLMALGFLPGTPVEVVAVAPFGDPITVRLGEWRVSLRRSQAALVEITTDDRDRH